jgi:ATP-binding cassette subfamily C protein CydD
VPSTRLKKRQALRSHLFSEKNVPDHLSANQTAFEQRKTREQHCKQWLKTQQKSVANFINCTALAGIANGLLLVLQSALLAFILHSVLIEKQRLLFIPLNQLNFDLAVFFTGLLNTQPANTTHNLVLPALLLFVLVMLLRSGCVYLFQALGFEAAAKIKTALRETLLNKLPILDPHYFKQHQSGELAATTLEQVEALELYFSRYCPQQLIIAILPLLMIAIVWPVNWVVAVIFLVAMPLVIFFMALIGISAAAASRSQFLAMARMGGYFLDRLQGLATLKLFGQAQRELNHITKVANDFRGTTMKVLRIAFLSSTVLEFFSAVAVALIAVYVGLGLVGKIDFGPAEHINLQQALFVLLLAPEFFMPLRQLGVFYHDRAAALGAADLILKVLEAPVLTWDEKSVVKIHSPFCLELNNVSKHYAERQVLSAINLQIEAGEKVALVGESGAGKTTLLKLLLGFEKADQGQVLMYGLNINPDYAHENMAWIGQSSSIFYGTISNNISLFNNSYSDAEIRLAATAAGVTEFSQALELGLDTVIGERGYGLSGGQIQRIAVARAFLKNAPIVLLDEPTAHLDEQNKMLLLDVIENLFKDKTVIIASHDAAVIERMSRQVMIENGQLIV